MLPRRRRVPWWPASARRRSRPVNVRQVIQHRAARSSKRLAFSISLGRDVPEMRAGRFVSQPKFFLRAPASGRRQLPTEGRHSARVARSADRDIGGYLRAARGKGRRSTSPGRIPPVLSAQKLADNSEISTSAGSLRNSSPREKRSATGNKTASSNWQKCLQWKKNPRPIWLEIPKCLSRNNKTMFQCGGTSGATDRVEL